MAHKLFIVQRGNERLYAALRSALVNEPEVEIFYDRRHGVGSPPNGVDRREASDVAESIRRNGFAVIRLSSPPRQSQNIRWA